MAILQQPSYLSATGFDRAAILRTAWALAKMRAERDGRAIKSQFAAALSDCWHNARCEARRSGRVVHQRMSKTPGFVAQQIAIYGTTAYGRAA